MSTFNEAAHPRGATGQFASKQLAEAGDLGLDAPAGSVLEADWEPDDAYPYPQANDLDKVSAVVDCVAAGADTSDGVASALDVDDRQGGYYLSAAGWLGLVEKHAGEYSDSDAYRLTDLGADFAEQGPQGRSATLTDMVDRLDDPERAVVDFDGLSSQLQRSENLDVSTAKRRASTMRSWAAYAADPDHFGTQIESARQDVSSRLDGARQVSAQQHTEAKRARMAAAPKRGEICEKHFIEKSLDGHCDLCD